MHHQFCLSHEYSAVIQLSAHVFDARIAHVLDFKDPDVGVGLDGLLDVRVQSLDLLFAVFGGFGGRDHTGTLGFRHGAGN